MSNKIEVDRALLVSIFNHADRLMHLPLADLHELRALLAATEWDGPYGAGHGKATLHPLQKCLQENGELIAVQATIAQQAQMIEHLKSTQRHGEPVAWSVLVDAVSDVIGCKFEQDPACFIGHQMTGINFSSLARIVDKFHRPAEQPAPIAMVLPDNLLSHRSAWLDAMDRLVELEPASNQPDSDDKGFWERERKAMHDMYSDLDRLNTK